jgi:predicted esterase
MNTGVKWIVLIGLGAFALTSGLPATASEKISLPIIPGLTRADVYVAPAEGNAAGTLILCPGRNGNGEDMVENPDWNCFAKKQNLNLVGLSFASSDDPQDRGYFRAELGSGQILLDGLRRAFGAKPLPLLLYGFSRGAQFTYTFSCWKPDLVMAWCAYSSTAWENPEIATHEPIGIIACGDEDEPNYSSAAFQFLQGRSMAKPWTWVSLAHMGHNRSVLLETFVREYFASVLLNPKRSGLWLDVDTKTPVTLADLEEHPTLATWLPDEAVARTWRNLHQP